EICQRPLLARKIRSRPVIGRALGAQSIPARKGAVRTTDRMGMRGTVAGIVEGPRYWIDSLSRLALSIWSIPDTRPLRPLVVFGATTITGLARRLLMFSGFALHRGLPEVSAHERTGISTTGTEHAPGDVTTIQEYAPWPAVHFLEHYRHGAYRCRAGAGTGTQVPAMPCNLCAQGRREHCRTGQNS